ncbi:MAG: hypothetical protein JSR98_20150 [Proteobacteria bacterium]|nr:hypothetical protein [Pseudomonadota bacterium]
MTGAAEMYDTLEERLFAAAFAGRSNPWRVGARLLVERLGVEAAGALDMVFASGVLFASVVSAGDPRRFFVADEGVDKARIHPAAILLHTCPEGAPFDGDDLIAWSLTPGSSRVWRWTGACAYLGELRPDHRGVTRLYQDAHGWLRRVLKAELVRRRVRDAMGIHAVYPVEAAWPAGALILDPAAIDWTRKGVLAQCERIEIADAPARGPLGQALQALNRSIGSARGVELVGQVPMAPVRRQAA